jgi:hypothetical protein
VLTLRPCFKALGALLFTQVLCSAASAVTLIGSWGDSNYTIGPWVFSTLTSVLTPGAPTPYVATTGHLTGGNTGAYREDEISFPSWINGRYAARAVVLAINNDAAWTPTTSPTAFDHLEFDRDERDWVQHGHQVLIKQGDDYFVSTSYVSIPWNGSVWVSPNTDSFVATDFGKLDPTTLFVDWSTNPNFTTGAQMKFGYAYWGERTFGGTITDGHGDIDNWAVRIYRS